MTQRLSASPHEQQLRDVKARLLTASRGLSPTKFVQKHPFISVGAAAATTMVVTAMATSKPVRHTTGAVAAAMAKPGAKGLISLAEKVLTVYLSTKAAAATTQPDPQPQQQN